MHYKLSNIRVYAEPTASEISSSNISIPSSPTLPKVSLDPGLLELAKAYPDLEQQVIVHCEFNPGFFLGPRIRIWPTTYLIPKGGTTKAKLLQVDHISFYPEWTPIERFTLHRFTLIFEGLPKECTSFDLIEEIPEPGGFVVRDIPRVTSDIYTVSV
jgi:hypothetical protein